MSTFTVGNLSVKVSVDTSGLTAGQKRVGNSFAKMGTQMRSSINNFTKWGAAATAAAIAVSAAIFKSTASNIDALAKTADKLGLATEKLAGLRFAAEQTGISQQTLDMALQRSTRRIAEAAQGTGEAIKALDTLGLSAEDLAKKSPDEQMRAIADAMGEVEGEGQKLALAFKLFDSEGAALVNTLAGGSAALDEFQSQAEALGIAINRVDAAKVEAANDAMNRMGRAITGAAQAATVELAPIVAAVADKFVESAIQAGGFGVIAKAAFEKVIKVVGFLADMLRGVEVVAKVVEVGFLGMGAVIVKTGTTILAGWSMIFEQIGNGLRGLIQIANKLPMINISTDGLDQFTERLQAEQVALTEMGDVAVAAVKESADELAELAMKPLPSEAIQAFADGAVEAANTAVEEMARIRAEADAAGGLTDDEDSALITQTKAESEVFLEELRLRYLTAQEIRQEAYDLDLEMLKAARENELLTEEEFNKRKEQLDQEFATDSVKITKAEQSLKNRLVGQGGESLLGTLASSAKRGTAIQKVAAKAQAVIAIATGAAKALALGLPAAIPEGIRVATVGAAALAQIGAGGSSNIPTGGSGGSSIAQPSTAPAPAAGQGVLAPAQPSQFVNIAIPEEALMSGSGVRNLIELINEQTDDGVQLIVTTV